jgi:MoaA/NifB/PqqE/SkfB family radical SAM enzyme
MYDAWCPVPFMEVFIRNDGTVLMCCDTDDIVGNVHENSLTEIFNSEIYQSVRESMINNVKTPVCNLCWTREEKVGHSYRNYFLSNEGIKHTTGFDNKESFYKDAGTKIRYMKVDFSAACNMKCPMCNVHRSTGWIKDKKAFEKIDPEFDGVIKNWDTITAQIPKSFVDDNWDIIYDSYFIDMSGGEPFYSQTAIYLLERLVEADWKGRMKIITNASLVEPYIPMLKKFNNIGLVISVDGSHDLYEYMRPISGGEQLNWEGFERIVQKLKKEGIGFSFSYTPQLLNIKNIITWFDWANQMTTKTLLNQPLTNPSYLQIENYPDEEYKQKLANDVENYSFRSNLNEGKKLALINKLRTKHNPVQYEQFLRYINTLDSIRNQSFKSIMPKNA